MQLKIHILDRKAFHPALKIILCPRLMILEMELLNLFKSLGRQDMGEKRQYGSKYGHLHSLFFLHTYPSFYPPTPGFPHDIPQSSAHCFSSLSLLLSYQRDLFHLPHAHAQHNHPMRFESGRSIRVLIKYGYQEWKREACSLFWDYML